ncbi:MAG: hypothetical protein Q4C96_10105 [Planctomycetia bacterium]|nr:hypothetical protein [Planctomycetia bacterium]
MSVTPTSVFADIDVDSNNDGIINETDDPIEMGNRQTNLYSEGAFGKLVARERTFNINLAHSTGYSDSLLYVQISCVDDSDAQILFPQYTVSSTSIQAVAASAGQAKIEYRVYLKETKELLVSDQVLVTVVDVGLQPYTPETTYIDPMAIPTVNWQKNNVGIRRNTDFDNGSTTPDSSISGQVANENDLTRVDIIFTELFGTSFVLVNTNENLKLWDSSTKGTQHTFTNGKCAANTIDSFWAEYASAGNENYSIALQLVETATNKVVFEETMLFRPFNSITCAFVGENQTAGNANISPGVNDWVIAQLFDGYDVHVWDDGHDGNNNQNNCNPLGEGRAFDEICNAINNRGVTQVAAIGYSHGGGSVYNLSWRMRYDGKTSDNSDYLNPPQRIFKNYQFVFTSYIDAISNSSNTDRSPETRRPLGSMYHVNQYQKNTYYLGMFSVNGAPSNGDIDQDRSSWLDANGNKLDHETINGDARVLYVLTNSFKEKVIR